MPIPVISTNTARFLPPLAISDDVIRRMVLDYLVYEGFVDSAKSFAAECIDMESPIEIESSDKETKSSANMECIVIEKDTVDESKINVDETDEIVDLESMEQDDPMTNGDAENEDKETEDASHDAVMQDASASFIEDASDEESVEEDVGMLSKDEILRMMRRIRIKNLISQGRPQIALELLHRHFPGVASPITPPPLPLPSLPLRFPDLTSRHSMTMLRLNDAQNLAFYQSLYDLAKYHESLQSTDSSNAVKKYDYSTTDLALVISQMLPRNPLFSSISRDDEIEFQLKIRVFEREVFLRNTRAKLLHDHTKDSLSPFQKAFLQITNPKQLNLFFWTATEDMKAKLRIFVDGKVMEEMKKIGKDKEGGKGRWTSEEVLMTYIDQQCEKMIKIGLHGTESHPQISAPHLGAGEPVPLYQPANSYLASVDIVPSDRTLIKKHGPGAVGAGRPSTEEIDERGQVKYVWEKGTWTRLKSKFIKSDSDIEGEPERKRDMRWYNLELDLKIQEFIERIRQISLDSVSPSQSPASSLILPSNPSTSSNSNSNSNSTNGKLQSKAPLMQALDHARSLHLAVQLLPNATARADALKKYSTLWGLLGYKDLTRAPQNVTSWLGETRRKEVCTKVWKACADQGSEWSALEAVARQAVSVWEVHDIYATVKMPGERVTLEEWLKK